ncbi:MAG TPA: TetR/AcrR family transcriptional regulator [Caulobacteraceae bacterium]|nr:TetR/AcrR family transcriptional regulator [Caulobacteraceae bacterium]
MPSQKGQPKGDKRARTRGRLIEAASEVIGEVGFEATSLEAVAQRAGMSRGAIYGNFHDRDELFLAVVESRWRPVAPDFSPGAGYAERMRRLGQALIQALPARRAAAVGAASFSLYALTHPDMRGRLVRANAEAYRQAAEAIIASGEDDLPMPPDDFVKMLHAVIEGLVMLANLTPELVTPETIRRTFEALALIEGAS